MNSDISYDKLDLNFSDEDNDNSIKQRSSIDINNSNKIKSSHDTFDVNNKKINIEIPNNHSDYNYNTHNSIIDTFNSDNDNNYDSDDNHESDDNYNSEDSDQSVTPFSRNVFRIGGHDNNSDSEKSNSDNEEYDETNKNKENDDLSDDNKSDGSHHSENHDHDQMDIDYYEEESSWIKREKKYNLENNISILKDENTLNDTFEANSEVNSIDGTIEDILNKKEQKDIGKCLE